MNFGEYDKMNSEYRSKIRDLCTRRSLFSEEGFSALTSLFEEVSGEPPSVYADRFRADHYQWLQLLNDFEHKYQFLKRTKDGQSCVFNPYALPLVETERAGLLLDTMEKIYQYLRELYRVHLKAPIDTVKLLEDESLGDIIMNFYQHYEHMDSSLSRNSSMPLISNETNLAGSNNIINPEQPPIIGHVKWALDRGLLIVELVGR